MDENDEEEFYYKIYNQIFEPFIEQNKVIPLSLLLKYQNIKTLIQNLKKEISKLQPNECNEIYSITDSVTSPEQQRLETNLKQYHSSQEDINLPSSINNQNQQPNSTSSQPLRATLLTSLTINSSLRFSSPPKVQKIPTSSNQLPSDDEWHQSSVSLQFSPDIYRSQQYAQSQQLNPNKNISPSNQTLQKETSFPLTASGTKERQKESKKTSPELTINDLNISHQPSFIIGQALIKDTETNYQNTPQLINQSKKQNTNTLIHDKENINSPKQQTVQPVIFNIETPVIQDEQQIPITVKKVQLRNPKIIKGKLQSEIRIKKFKKQNYQIYTYQQLILALKKIGVKYQSREQAINALQKAESEKQSSPIALTQYEILPDTVRISREQEIKRLLQLTPFWYKQIIQYIPIDSKQMLKDLKELGLKGVSQGFLNQYLLRSGILTTYTNTSPIIAKTKRRLKHKQLTLSQMRHLGTKKSQ